MMTEQHNVKTRHCPSRGFTLLEMAIAIMVVGILLAPAIMLYGRYIDHVRAERTNVALKEARAALGGFRSNYGRYPCPADPTLGIDDPGYGYEACGTGGVITTTSARVGLADPNIYIGALPFREMNLQEDEAIDGYGNLLTYAVTASLTVDDTFNMANGGITILDQNNQNKTQPNDSAHFVVISHNENSDGARTIGGGISGGACPAATLETENCDGDSVFRAASRQNGFDDLVAYSTSIDIHEWRYSETDPYDIHLRTTEKFALGLSNDTESPVGADLEIQNRTPGSGVARVTSGTLNATELCKEDGSGCFEPETIGGCDAGQANSASCPSGPSAGEGMYCPPGQFAVAVAGGGLICDNEIWFTCPDGEFFKGFNANREIICDTEPPPGCPAMTVTTTCGRVTTIDHDSEPYPGGHPSGLTPSGQYRYAYSGECHMIDPLDTAALNAAVVPGNTAATVAAVQAIIDTLNNAPRTTMDCEDAWGTSADNSWLVRDTWQCLNGSWTSAPNAPINTLETLNSRPFPNWGAMSTCCSRPAETNGVAFDSANPMATDPENDDWNHDCWCREDYRVITAACPGGPGVTGQRVIVQEKYCPQTTNNWANRWSTNQTCGCVPGTTTSTQSCASYYGVGSSQINGNVVHTYDITCPGGPTGAPVTSPVPSSTDVSACTCPARADNISTVACPFGTTNSFSWGGNTYNDVSQIWRRTWGCPPPTPGPVNPATASDAGNWTAPVLEHTEPCVCDTALTKNVTDPCPAGTMGSGITYEVEWDCAAGAWEPRAQWSEISNDCNACVWQKPSGAPEIKEIATPNRIGTGGCTCGETGMCHKPVGGGYYQVYTGCSCVAN